MTDPAELDRFLAGVERRAYLQARFAVRDEAAALDVVQDAMIKLVTSYRERPTSEWPLLFQRILQNTIKDYYRRQKVINAWQVALSALGLGDRHDSEEEGAEFDPPGPEEDDPAERVAQGQRLAIVEKCLQALPLRQRQAFLLRYWEGMDTAQTAEVMGCTEGSVKTHCSRAVAALSKALAPYGIEL